VPLLLKLYADEETPSGLRREIGEALKRIDPEAAKKAGVQ
jgi:hypothetical protein